MSVRISVESADPNIETEVELSEVRGDSPPPEYTENIPVGTPPPAYRESVDNPPGTVEVPLEAANTQAANTRYSLTLVEGERVFYSNTPQDNSDTTSVEAAPSSSCCPTMENEKTMKFILIVVAIVALLLVILLPMSFSDLDYYEMGFKKSKISGSVDTSRVYTGGRHFLGVSDTFKVFKADAHILEFEELSIYNEEKIEVKMACSLQYFLRKEDLKLLHDRFDVNYQPVLSKTAASAIKNQASKYSIEEYRLMRTKVSQGLADAAAFALGGNCCRKDCNASVCRPNCKEYSKCNNTDKGLFADLSHFQMLKVDITADQEKRFLQQVLEQELKDTEKFKQNETITRKKTEEEKRLIENQALEVAQNASATATLMKEKAKAESKQIVENARTSGLSTLYGMLNVTSEEDKKAIDYIRTLRNKDDANIYIGFQYMVASKP